MTEVIKRKNICKKIEEMKAVRIVSLMKEHTEMKREGQRTKVVAMEAEAKEVRENNDFIMTVAVIIEIREVQETTMIMTQMR